MDDEDNEFMRKALERLAAEQRNHEDLAEKIGELVQNLIAAGMPEGVLQTAVERGVARGVHLRDKHQSEGQVVDIKR